MYTTIKSYLVRPSAFQQPVGNSKNKYQDLPMERMSADDLQMNLASMSRMFVVLH